MLVRPARQTKSWSYEGNGDGRFCENYSSVVILKTVAMYSSNIRNVLIRLIPIGNLVTKIIINVNKLLDRQSDKNLPNILLSHNIFNINIGLHETLFL